jgi:hypothetical protein
LIQFGKETEYLITLNPIIFSFDLKKLEGSQIK